MSIHRFEASPEHSFLAKQAGEWKVHCTYEIGPDMEPLEIEGLETVEMLGEFWLAARFEADFIGTPMSGHASTGYDPVRQIFVGTWKDSSNPFLYTFEGFLDAEKKTLKMSGENFDPVRRVSSMYRSVIEYLSPKEKILTLSVEDEDGGVRNILEYHYKRL